MADKIRMVLHIDEDAAALLEKMATPRGKGEYISNLIRQAAQRQHIQDTGILERIEAKVDRILDRGA